jgi:hypothetical protein
MPNDKPRCGRMCGGLREVEVITQVKGGVHASPTRMQASAQIERNRLMTPIGKKGVEPWW